MQHLVSVGNSVDCVCTVCADLEILSTKKCIRRLFYCFRSCESLRCFDRHARARRTAHGGSDRLEAPAGRRARKGRWRSDRQKRSSGMAVRCEALVSGGISIGPVPSHLSGDGGIGRGQRQLARAPGSGRMVHPRKGWPVRPGIAAAPRCRDGQAVRQRSKAQAGGRGPVRSGQATQDGCRLRSRARGLRVPPSRGRQRRSAGNAARIARRQVRAIAGRGTAGFRAPRFLRRQARVPPGHVQRRISVQRA